MNDPIVTTNKFYMFRCRLFNRHMEQFYNTLGRISPGVNKIFLIEQSAFRCTYFKLKLTEEEMMFLKLSVTGLHVFPDRELFENEN